MGSNYSEAEVARMVAYYPYLVSISDVNRRGMRFTIMMADLEQAMSKLDEVGWKVVLLCGLLGLPQHTAAALLETSQRSVSRRYADALEDIHYYINGGE